MKQPTVFRVYFKCMNCGSEWSREFPKGLRVVERGYPLKVLLFEGIEFNKSLSCPNCECDEDVKITKREVI